MTAPALANASKGHDRSLSALLVGSSPLPHGSRVEPTLFLKSLPHAPAYHCFRLTPASPGLGLHISSSREYSLTSSSNTLGWVSFPFDPKYPLIQGFPGSPVDKESTCNAGDPGSIPVLGSSPGGKQGNPLQYSCLENPMDRGAWWLQSTGS